MEAKFTLPTEIAQGATVRGNEYGWTLDAFPPALARAQALGHACLGGQFQFRLDDGTYEMYWLNADSNDRHVRASHGQNMAAALATKYLAVSKSP
jgi:hypothetical protein